MQQLQFLGRTPVVQGRRTALDNLLHHITHLGMDNLTDELLVRYLDAQGFSVDEVRAIRQSPEETLRRLRRVDHGAPEFLGELARQGAARTLSDDVRRFGDVIAAVPHLLHLDRCEQDDDGSFAISYHLPEHAGDVAENDRFFAGVCLSGNAQQGTLHVAPRVVRQVCTNGMVAVTNETGAHGVFSRDGKGGVAGDVGEAVEAGLSCETVDAVVERMKALRAKEARDSIEALEQEGVLIPASAWEQVRRVYAENEDRTAYGAFNALTQTARDAARVSRRVRLETCAGAVMACTALHMSQDSFREDGASWR